MDQIHIYDQAYTIVTGNDMMDYLLLDLKKKCDGINTELKIDIRTDQIINMDDYDFIALYGNLFENAYEAVSKISRENDRYIEIKMKRRDNYFIMKIRNSVALENYSKAARLQTWKDDKAVHGIGMKNVNKIAEKHNGTITTAIDQGIFTAVVMILDK